MSESLRTHLTEQEVNVERHLRDLGGEWGDQLDFTVDPTGDRVIDKLLQLNEAIRTETDANPAEVNAATVYDIANVRRMAKDVREVPYKADWAFFVTRRESQSDLPGRPSESDAFSRTTLSQFHVSPWARVRAQTGWNPTILAEYGDGVLMLPPSHPDMYKNILQGDADAFVAAQEGLRQAVGYARQMGVRAIGLGALLPKITNFGEVIRDMEEGHDMVTTTGHGGTVHLIVETAKSVMRETQIGHQDEVGVIGVGSIGSASIAALLSDRKEGPRAIRAYDKYPSNLDKNLATRYHDQVTMEEGDQQEAILSILRNTNVIVTAVTTPINLDEYDPNGELDLSGKVIIDDSQPGSFIKEQVEARGGHLLWVVGEDQSADNFATRQGGLTFDGQPYNYGDGTGLAGRFDVFGCEAEVATISRLGKYAAAIEGPVVPRRVKRIGRMMGSVGIGVANYQSYGQFVDLDQYRHPSTPTSPLAA